MLWFVTSDHGLQAIVEAPDEDVAIGKIKLHPNDEIAFNACFGLVSHEAVRLDKQLDRIGCFIISNP